MRKIAKNRVLALLFAAIIICMASMSAFSQRLVDSFEYSNAEVSMMLVDKFIIELQNNSNASGYFIIYGSKLNKKGEVEAHIAQLRNYLMSGS